MSMFKRSKSIPVCITPRTEHHRREVVGSVLAWLVVLLPLVGASHAPAAGPLDPNDFPAYPSVVVSGASFNGAGFEAGGITYLPVVPGTNIFNFDSLPSRVISSCQATCRWFCCHGPT